MYPLVESIRIENRHLHHTNLHNLRINKALQAVFGQKQQVDIESIVKIPSHLTNDRYKCRLVFYPNNVEYTISPYIQREINTLKVVHDDTIDYTFKSEDRRKLDEDFALKDNCDDIIIVKNGFITDAWASNVIFSDGTAWFTSNTPLLRGVQRKFLLQEGIISEIEITVSDIFTYKKVKLINAMIDFERAPVITIPEGIFI
jgi:4-amino-4-deoxychorismate lyase